ncbi:TRAM domain-containing protein [Halobaculum lipolyticum]
MVAGANAEERNAASRSADRDGTTRDGSGASRSTDSRSVESRSAESRSAESRSGESNDSGASDSGASDTGSTDARSTDARSADAGSNAGGRGEPEPPVDRGDEVTVDIEGIGDQGDGIARVDRGYVIIVPDTEKGERVSIRVTSVKQNVAFAEVVDRIERQQYE